MRAAAVLRSSWAVALLFGALVAPNAATSQRVTPRTVPVQQSGQFDVFPSERASMAGVSLAIDDTLLDPFVNPAKASRLHGGVLFTEFGTHRVTRGGGGGRTIPVGAIGSRGPWSAGALLAFQTLDADAVVTARSVADRPENRYASVSLARRLPRGFSLGAGTFDVRLEALDGMHALYTGSDSIALLGKINDLRVGILKEWRSGRTAEIVVLHNRTDVSHDVTFRTGAWDPNTGLPSSTTQFEHHDDRTRVIGAHTEFVTRASDSARFGWLATVNRLNHPKVPSYRFSNLPRDPGTTYAYNFGFGASKLAERSAYAIDLIYEPVFSHTWAEAGPNATDEDGMALAPDARTVENRFRFSNVKFRVGVSTQMGVGPDTSKALDIEFGLSIARNAYHLRRQNNLTGAVGHQDVDWFEWGPAFGLLMRTRHFQIGYRGRLSCSPGACSPSFGHGEDLVQPDGPGVIAAPGPILALDYGHVFVQKLSIVVPLRGR